MKSRSFLGLGLVAAAFLAAPKASAAGSSPPDGFALNRFDPAERGSRWLVLDSLEIQGHGRPALGLTLDYQYRPLAVYLADGTVKDVIVGHVVTTNVGANVVLWDRVRVGANLPVVVYQEGTSTSAYRAPADAQAAGDLRLGLDLRLFGKPNGPVTMALGGRVYLPTGSPASYTSDGRVRGGPRVAVAGKLGPFVYAANAMAMFRDPKTTEFAGVHVYSELDFGASAGLAFHGDRITVGPELYGATQMSSDAFKTRETPLELLLGGHWNVAHGFHAGVGVGTALVAGYGEPRIRALGSVEWSPDATSSDADGDGIPDDKDACPKQKGPRSADPDKNGCPLADTDADGIPDDFDACPGQPGRRTNDPRTNGCDDTDGDGILDPLDACPNVAGVADADPAKNGCPVVKDRDGDGVADGQDACPDKPGPADPDPAKNGCPDPDRDKDGIPNDTDACPDVPGAANPKPSRNGCPIAFVHGSEIWIKEQVNFKLGSAELDGSKLTVEVLNAVRDILVAHPEIKKVRVEGHTDSRGNAGWNKKLSGARAVSVMNWLTRHGISKDRLTAKGWGSERPLDTNDTDAGRAANRRVEFHIEDPPPPSDDAATK